MRQPSTTKQPSLDQRLFRSITRPIVNTETNQITGRLIRERDESAVAVTPVNTVTDTVVSLPRATLAGVTLQVEFVGAPVQVKLAVPPTFAAELSNNG
jgi:hypothetical protein